MAFEPGIKRSESANVNGTYVDAHFYRLSMSVESLTEKALDGFLVSLFSKKKINSISFLLKSALQVAVTTFDLDSGFIHTPRAFHGFCFQCRVPVEVRMQPPGS